jgi:Subtilase family
VRLSPVIVVAIAATLAPSLGPAVPASGATAPQGQVTSSLAPRYGTAAVAGANRGAGRILIDWPAAGPPPIGAGDRITSLLPRLGIAVLSVDDVAAALATYRRLPGVAWAEADRAVVAAGVPDDPLYGGQWALQSGPGASPQSLDWATVFPSVEGAGALVAVLDTGFEPGGSDQPVNLRLALAKTFVPGTTDTSDDNGHGTFVTDIIAEATDNGIGAAGIAPQASVVPIKVLGADGTGDLSVVIEGIGYAVSIGAKVINLSLAGDPSAALCAAVAAAATTSIVIAATGNDASARSLHSLDYPAACPGVLAVGSVAFDGTRPAYANTGCGMGVVAPGGDDLDLFQPGVMSSDWITQQGFDTNPADAARRGTFQYFQEEGTSMSAAQVAGEAALLVGLGADTSTVHRLIVGTARPDGAGDAFDFFGAGTADIGAAVSAFQSHRVVAVRPRAVQLATESGTAVSVGDPCTGTTRTSAPVVASRPVVGEAAVPDGLGSWLVARDGGIFTFGDARFFGSTGALTLNQPIVGMASTPTGNGYWLVARDGGIFTFGDAAFLGSPADIGVGAPIVGMAATPSGRGYWLAGSDGSVFPFGDAPAFGNGGGAGPVVGIVAETPSGS